MMWKPSRAVFLSLVVSLLALALAVYGASVSPAEAPQPRPVPPSLSAARFFVLLPDGRVEITDAWSRRVFRWDGHRWTETESLSLQRPDSR
jgi:peptidoglycan/LPS O-acetylase OafA/YrhL